MSKSIDQADCVLTERHPTWLDTIVRNEYFDEELYQIILFYIIFSPCPQYCTQGRSLQYYGWKEKPWRTNRYLKAKLDAGVFERKSNFFRPVQKIPDLKEAFRKAKLENDFFKDRSFERVAFLNTEDNSYMSLFRHVRCALAHGRLAIYPTPDNKDAVLVMENGNEKGAYFQVKARMVLRKSTLLKWSQIVRNGPQEDENTYYQDVYLALLRDKTLRRKDLMTMLNESEYAINRAVNFLQRANIITYHNHSRNSWWEVNAGNAEKRFKNMRSEVSQYVS